MNTSFNYSGFIDMFIDSNENPEINECNKTNESIERIYNLIQNYKAGYSNKE